MFTSEQLGEYFLDLRDSRMESAIALVHSRFSTNTFPSWDLAQPFRMLAHNGEINTVKGNRFWMQARESILKSEVLGDLDKIYPVIEPDKSDSASLDNVLEFLGDEWKIPSLCHVGADPGILERKESHLARTESLLPVPFYLYGALGRSGFLDLQRRTGILGACWTGTDFAPPAM